MAALNAINEFVIRFANVNGSGSASANVMFAKIVYRMGVPVAPKNIFPSNIQGLPTWFEARVSAKGHLGRREGVDLMVAMNPQTFAEDLADVVPGGYLLYDSTFEQRISRTDVNVIGVPLTRLCLEAFEDPRQRQLFKNVAYVGALAAFLDIDFEAVKEVVSLQFRGKEKLVGPNIQALELGRDYALRHYDCPLGLRVEKCDAVGDKIMIDGNSAAALGCVFGGATVAAWYPITPSTSVAEAFERYCERMRVDEKTGEHKYAIIQAEDELAAIGMAIGANWNGARGFTATSGPGISLMTEFLGLAYFAEIPLVLFNVQRGGPSTGMPTRTQQSDITACAYASHGDTKQMLLFPSEPNECFNMSADAFDYADRLQTPIIVMSDLDLGMNDWVCDPFEWDQERRFDRGKVLDAEALDKIEKFGRYRDVDGDGICYRTYPGTHPEKGAFFTRGTSRDNYAVYTEDGDVHAENLRRLNRKFDTGAKILPGPEFGQESQRSTIGIIYFGTTATAMPEALEQLEDQDIIVDTMRIRAFPFALEVAEFVRAHETVYIIEQNRDAQMRMLLMNECDLAPDKMKKILNYDGMPVTARFIAENIAAAVKPGARQGGVAAE
ncbi:MAG: 2-oxoacid:acceptor oxidoreductase subunit alpha [Rhodospirillaceae bacterium]|nr:2-oxoacid:acceptor oxidoreductase subunit alpha [Rhodospirillaceae bacterium]